MERENQRSGQLEAADGAAEQPSYRDRRVRHWLMQLWAKGLRANWRQIAPAPLRPQPAQWSDEEITAAWIGHATVLINFFGVNIVTDPVFFPRIGVRIPFVATLGPKRLTAPALTMDALPRIDLVLLSHAHFDHTDRRSLSRFDRKTKAITAARTRDLLRWTRLRDVTELGWGESRVLEFARGQMKVRAFRVKHWGARMHIDHARGYNGYLLERNGHRILFGGDTAFTEAFASAGQAGPVDLAIMPIGCYDPWIANHGTPEEAVRMAAMAGARFILPVHHQTFRLSFEPFAEPIERFVAALAQTPEKIALRQLGETFVLPRA